MYKDAEYMYGIAAAMLRDKDYRRAPLIDARNRMREKLNLPPIVR
jgi:hypothetical protein